LPIQSSSTPRRTVAYSSHSDCAGSWMSSALCSPAVLGWSVSLLIAAAFF
jgi:hypothetical protein